VSHIIYLSKARLPTEKAHGFQVMKMCEGMAALGHDVELLHPRREQGDVALRQADPFAYYGVRRTFSVRTLSNWDVVRLEGRLPDLPFRVLFAAHDFGWGLLATWRAAQAHPDLIYTRNPSFAYWAARLGRPCVFEAHLPPSRRMVPFVRALSKHPCLRAAYALTSYTAADLEAAGLPREKVGVLPDAADLTAFANAPSKEAARRRLDLPPRRRIIGYVGRFETMGKEKGIGDLIRAMAVPVLRRTDPLLLCVGGPMGPVGRYTALADSIGVPSTALRFVDRVPTAEMPTWLAALDVAAMPYPDAEHYATAMSPLKLFEYMAAGLPIVATDLPSLREVLEDGENALLAPPGDPEALAGRLARLLEDEGAASALGERARRSAARYTWERRAERALALAL
jgi:glycosyltransferase involved in cell wall biosynthesis